MQIAHRLRPIVKSYTTIVVLLFIFTNGCFRRQVDLSFSKKNEVSSFKIACLVDFSSSKCRKSNTAIFGFKSWAGVGVCLHDFDVKNCTNDNVLQIEALEEKGCIDSV